MRAVTRLLLAVTLVLGLFAAVPLAQADDEPTRPANDDFADTIVIEDGVPYSNEQSIVGATLEDGEPYPCYDVGGTVWYQYTPEEDQTLVLDTVGSDFDTVLAVHTGEDFEDENWATVGCNRISGENHAQVVVEASEGVTYHIQVAGYHGQFPEPAEGDLVLNLYESPCPGGRPAQGPISGPVFGANPQLGCLLANSGLNL